MWVCVVIYPEEVLPNQEAITTYTWLHVTFAFLIVIAVLYSAIAISEQGPRGLRPKSSTACSKETKTSFSNCGCYCRAFWYILRPISVERSSGSWPCVCLVLRSSIYFIVKFASCSSSVVNPIIWLVSFVGSYRRGLRNILCSCGKTRNVNRYVQKCRLMRCMLIMISITKCPLS